MPEFDYDAYLERKRKNPARPQTPPTLLGGTATGGGPAQEEPLAAQRLQQTARPEPTEPGGPLVQGGARIAGSMAGRAIGALGGPGGAVLGSSFGQLAAGELVRPPNETDEEKKLRRKLDLIGGAGSELLTQGLGAGYQAAKQYFTGKQPLQALEAGTQEAQALLREYDATLTPGQTQPHSLWGKLEQYVSSSFFGGKALRNTQQRAQNAAYQAFDDATEKFVATLTPQETGSLLDDAIKGSAQIQRAATRAAYKAVDDKIALAGAQSVVDIAPRADLVARLKPLVDAGHPEALQIWRLAKVGSTNTMVDFKTADTLKSVLYEYGNDQSLMPGVSSIANQFAKSIDTQMDAAALRLGPLGQDVIDAYRVARETSKFGKETFNNKVIASLLRKDPEDITRALIGANNPTPIANVRKIIYDPSFAAAVGDPDELWKSVQGNYIAQVRSRAGEGTYHLLDGGKLASALDKSGGTFEALFPDPIQRNSVKIAARAIELSQRTATTAGWMPIAIQITAGARAAQYFIGAGPKPPSGAEAAFEGMIALGPGAMIRVMSNPRIATLMQNYAASTATRAGIVTATASRASVLAAQRFLGELMTKMRDAGIPFSFTRKGGETYDYVPSPQNTGRAMTPGKPQSKMQAPPQ